MADDATPNLALPYIMPAQAQKHVTHNEAIRALDAIVQLSVLTRGTPFPPPSPIDGARYIVPAGADGAWAGHVGAIAAFQDGAWMFYGPRVGWTAWIADENALVAWDGAAWIAAAGSFTAAELLGINATADGTNRLAVASPASLFNHEGAGHQLKVNKATAIDTASLLFQTGFSGRAEMGTVGDDDFHIKVSADGTSWAEAILVDGASGAVSLPNTHMTAAELADELAADDAAIALATDDIEPGGPAFVLRYAHHPIDDGGPSSPDYHNHVMHLGWNIGAAGSRLDTGKPAWGISFESSYRFDSTSPFGCEWHLRMQDTGGAERRPISVFTSHDGASGGMTLAGDYIDILDLDGGYGYRLDVAAGEIDLTRGYLKGSEAWFTGDTDNAKNALLQVDGEVGENHAGVIIALNGDSDANALAMNFQTDQPGPLTVLYQNNDTGGRGNAHVCVVHRILAGGGGDAYTRYEKSGAEQWSIGYRPGDALFRIALNHDLGGGEKVDIRSNRIDLLEHVRVNRISGKNHNWGTVWFGGSNESGDDSNVGVGGPGGPDYGVVVRADADYSWSSDAGSANATRDLSLRRDAADTLAQRRGANAQTFRVYETFTDGSNYERASLSCSNDTATLAAESAGTGAADMDVALVPAGAGKVRFGTHSAIGSETVTGYITIKDAAGTLRKIAVVS